MENKKILKMKKMGMDIYKDPELEGITDLTNFRYYLHDIELKDGKICKVIEVMNGARYTEKSLKQCKSSDHLGTWVHFYWYDESGQCWGLSELEKELGKGNYTNGNLYTKKTVLDLINRVSKIKYDLIEEV